MKSLLLQPNVIPLEHGPQIDGPDQLRYRCHGRNEDGKAVKQATRGSSIGGTEDQIQVCQPPCYGGEPDDPHVAFSDGKVGALGEKQRITYEFQE